MKKITKLFEPIKIGNVELKNRVIMLGMTTGLGEDYGVNDRLIDFYAERARGGAGLLILGSAFVADFKGTEPLFRPITIGSAIWSDEFIPGMKALTKAIHDHGAKACCQLMQCWEWRPNNKAPLEAVGPSEGPGGPGVRHVRELSVDEIRLMIEQYAEGARRARDAGFDLVEFHCGIGYMINRFLSPYSNKRTDEYGGSLEKRMRFLFDIIDLTKKKAGNDYPIMCRISGDEFMPGGNTIEDMKKMAPMIEKAGVAALNVQAGWHESPRTLSQQWVPAGNFVYLAEEVKKVTSIPVVAAYRIDDANLAEDIVASGRADLVGLARALLVDPELPNKAREGRVDDIRRCIACCRCLDDVFVGIPPQCSVNAAFAREPIRPAVGKKKVLVIGSGPGGMEAARIAAMRGHQVTLCDRGSRLGGLMILASVLNDKLERLVQWMSREVRKLPIEIRMGTEVTPDFVAGMNPDEIIVAVGGDPVIPEVKGVHGDNVLSGFDIKRLMEGVPPKKGLLWSLAAIGAKYFGGNPEFMRRAMGFPWPIKKKVVIIGGGFAGCEVAMGLMKGRQVTILEESKHVGSDIGILDRRAEMDILKKGGVGMETLVKVTEITENDVKIVRAGGSDEHIEADTVMISIGVKENKRLADQLSSKFKNVYLIGDAAGGSGIRRIREAIAAGFEIGNKI